MEKGVRKDAGNSFLSLYFGKHKRISRRRRIVTCLAAVVVFCTVYALILPAITLEKQDCTLPEHTHTEDCYALVAAADNETEDVTVPETENEAETETTVVTVPETDTESVTESETDTEAVTEPAEETEILLFQTLWKQ